jgi:hypothetical protein
MTESKGSPVYGEASPVIYRSSGIAMGMGCMAGDPGAAREHGRISDEFPPCIFFHDMILFDS